MRVILELGFEIGNHFVDLTHLNLYLSCILYTFAFVEQTFEAVFYLYLRPAYFFHLRRFQLSNCYIKQHRKLVPPALCISVHFMVQVKLKNQNVFLNSELIVRDARINLVHPFFATLTRSAILPAAKIELFGDFSPLVWHLRIT